MQLKLMTREGSILSDRDGRGVQVLSSRGTATILLLPTRKAIELTQADVRDLIQLLADVAAEAQLAVEEAPC